MYQIQLKRSFFSTAVLENVFFPLQKTGVMLTEEECFNNIPTGLRFMDLLSFTEKQIQYQRSELITSHNAGCKVCQIKFSPRQIFIFPVSKWILKNDLFIELNLDLCRHCALSDQSPSAYWRFFGPNLPPTDLLTQALWQLVPFGRQLIAHS